MSNLKDKDTKGSNRTFESIDLSPLSNASYSSFEKEKLSRSPVLEIDPFLCKPWTYHNRDESWLTAEGCHDLIHSIQKNGQLNPVLLRKIKAEPLQYEIIYGVRRWFACSQLGQPLLSQITEADDQTCVILMHSENADSKDITEFERAISFAQQMKAGIFNTQAEMGEKMGISQGYISKLINAAEIFEYPWIKELFHHKRDIPIKQAYELSMLLKDPHVFALIKSEAEQILSEKEITHTLPIPTAVLKRLMRVSKSDPSSIQSIIRLQGKSLISCSRDKFGNFSLQIKNEVKHLKLLEIEEACLKAIREYIKKLLPEE